MKYFVLIASLLFSLTIFAETSPYSQPESVFYYQQENVYFVSNINGDEMGWISKINSDGSVLAKWAKNLQRPMGMRSFADRLWVNNKSEIVGLKFTDPTDRKIIKIDDAEILNDLATDSNGNAYLTDSMNNRVVKVNLKTGKHSTFLDTSPSSPNGIIVNGDRLYIASWGVMSDDPEEKKQWITKINGGLYWVPLNASNPKKTYVVEELGNLDGIEFDNLGNAYTSDWLSGKLYKISPDNNSVRVIGEYSQGLADIALNPLTGVIALPLMLDHKVLFQNFR